MLLYLLQQSGGEWSVEGWHRCVVDTFGASVYSSCSMTDEHPVPSHDQRPSRKIVAMQTGRLAYYGLVKCPGISQTKVKKFGLKLPNGDINPKVQCRNPAGGGTAHLGSGLCSWCETMVPMRPVKEKIARNHLAALQQHNPFSYRDVEKWMDEAQMEGRAFEQAYGIEAEVGLLRAQIQEILILCRLGERKDHPAVPALEKMQASLKELEFVDPDQGKRIVELLESTLAQCRTPLTEKGKTGPVPMSDATRFDTIRRLAATVSALARVKLSMDGEQNVSIADLKIWTGQIVAMTKRVLAAHPDLILGWAKEISKLPPPRTKQDSVRVEVG